jgi:hypothetical protein
LQKNPGTVKTIAKRARVKRLGSIRGKLRGRISSLMWYYLSRRGKQKAQDSKFVNLKWTIQDLIKHLESQFQERMSWNNYGKEGWSVDHKTPDSWFDYKDINDESFKKCWDLNNLQPLWVKDNCSKGNRYEG